MQQKVGIAAGIPQCGSMNGVPIYIEALLKNVRGKQCVLLQPKKLLVAHKKDPHHLAAYWRVVRGEMWDFLRLKIALKQHWMRNSDDEDDVLDNIATSSDVAGQIIVRFPEKHRTSGTGDGVNHHLQGKWTEQGSTVSSSVECSKISISNNQMWRIVPWSGLASAKHE
jgi:hypothetical protein